MAGEQWLSAMQVLGVLEVSAPVSLHNLSVMKLISCETLFSDPRVHKQSVCGTGDGMKRQERKEHNNKRGIVLALISSSRY